MPGVPVLAHATGGAGGSALASWTPLTVMLGLFTLAVGVLFVAGPSGGHRSPLGRLLQRVPRGLERLTGVPGWAAATAGLSMFALLMAGVGFYSDVAYHIAFGRDENLFTAPHVAILIGLTLILAAAVLAILLATLDDVPTRLRWGRIRVPWSALPLGVIGVGAVLGFPVDELWHRAYGVDVTMWSPPHLMMILGATLTGLASWLVVAESGVTPRDGAGPRAFHALAAWLTLLGLTAPAGEFFFGVPQWQQLYHPVLIMLAAGLALVPMRMVLGRGWALGVTAVAFALDAAGALVVAGSPIPTRPTGVFIGSALVVELVAAVVGTDRRMRFAILTGAGVGTVGLATEWAWNTGAHQPWGAALFPEAFVVGGAAALAAAVLGAAAGAALTRQRAGVPAPVLVLAGLGVAVVLAVPFPREVGQVRAEITLERPDADHAVVHATLDPADAADGARWFFAASWQGGDRVNARMLPAGDGRYVAERPIEVSGQNKSLLRLHRGAEMMAIAIRLPEDPVIGEPEVPATDRSAAFVSEQRYLQRETAAHDAAGPGLARATFGLLALLAAGWVLSLTVAFNGVCSSPPPASVTPRAGRAEVDSTTPT